MNNYEATFTVPAQVAVRLQVTGERQEHGIAAAHDALASAPLSSATVISMDLGAAELETFGLASAHLGPKESNPPDRLAEAEPVPGAYQVRFLTEAGRVLFELPRLALPVAKSVVGAMFQDPCSLPFRAEVLDTSGTPVFEERAKRGGWEVLGEPISGAPAEVISHLDRASSRRSLAQQLATGRFARVQLLDFSNRELGPMTVATVTPQPKQSVYGP